MPDIDSLSLNITASSNQAVKAINNIITALGELNSALSNYSAESKYVSGLNNLIGGFNGLSSSINSIDIQKIKSLSDALGTLAAKGERLAKLNFVQSFGEMGNGMARLNSDAKKTANEIVEMFDIPRRNRGAFQDAFKELYHAKNDDAFTAASGHIREMVREAQRSKSELSDTYKKIREYLRGSKLYLPQEVMSTWGDSAKSNRGVIGIGNTTTNIQEANLFLEDLASELNKVYGVSIDVEHGIMGMANSLVEFLSDEKYVQKVHVDLSDLGQLFDNLRAKIIGSSDAFLMFQRSAESADDEFATIDENGKVVYVKEQVEQTTAAMNNLASSTQVVKEELNSQALTNPFEGLITGIESLNGLEIPADKFLGVTTLADAFTKFGKGDAANAIEVIPQIGKAFADMARELSNAPAISDNLVRMAESLTHFSRTSNTTTVSTNNLAYSIVTVLFRSLKVIPVTLNGIYAALQKDIASLKNFANRVWGLVTALGRLIQTNTRTRLSFTSLAAVFGTLYANFFLLIRAARLLGKAIDYSSSMTEAQNVVSVTFGKQADALDDFAKTAIKDFGLARLSAVQFASRFQAMGKTMGITSEQIVKANDFIAEKVKGNSRAYKDLGTSVAEMSVNLTKLTADMASLYNQDYNDVADDMAAIYTGMTRPLRKYGLDLTQATLKEWAMSQGLDSNIEKMTQAQKTLLRYQYVMAHTAGAMGDFAKTADTWANSIRTVKQYLQELARVIGEGLINTFKPALIAFRNFLQNFISLAQSALNAVGKLLGWTKVDFGGATLVEDMEEYADAIDDATGAAKKLKGQLRGIDELNNLTTNQGGGGGGGVASALGLDGLDNWQELAESTEKYESVIDSWYELGLSISRKFTEGMLSIDWGKIYLNFMKFGNHLAELLNGLIQPGSFRIAGETVANGLNAIGYAFNRFFAKFDFKNNGVSIANFINGLFKNWDPDVWIENIRLALGGIIDTIDGFFNGMEGEFNHIDGLDIESIHEKIKTFITGTVEAIKTDLAKIDWKNVFEVFSTIGTNIADLLNSVITPENFKTVGETLARVLNAVFISLKDFGAEFNFIELGASLAAGINGLFEKWRPQDWADVLNNFVNGFFEVLNGLFMGDEEGNKGLNVGQIGLKIAAFIGSLDPKVIQIAFGAVMFKAITTILPILGAALKTLFTAFAPLFPKLFSTVLWPALQTFWTGTILPEIEGALIGLASKGGLIKIVTTALTNLGKGILTVVKTVFAKVIPGAFVAILTLFGSYSLGNMISQIGSYLSGDFVESDIAAEMSLPAILLKMLGFEWNGELWDETWNEAFDNIRNFFLGVKEDLKNVPAILEGFGKEWDEFWEGIFDDFGLDKFILLAEDIVAGIKEGFVNASGKIDLKLVFDNIVNAFKNIFGIHSPAKEMEPIGEFIILGILDGFNLVDFFGKMNEWFETNVLPWFTLEKWLGIFENIQKALKEIWDATVGVWDQDLANFFDQKVKPLFTMETWLGYLSGIKEAFESVWNDSLSFAKGFFNSMADFVEKFINGVIDGFGALIAAKNLLSDSPINFNIGKITIPRFVNGGYPAVGSLFIAGEAGSEMVGNINGRTGVASHGEITGISDTIRSTASAEIELLREQNVLLQGILEKEFGISNDSLFKSVRTSAREYTRRTGNPAW